MVFSSVLSSSSSHLYLPIKPRNLILSPIRCSSTSSSPSISTRSRSTQFDLKTYWTTLIAEIDQKLDEAIPVKYPEQIYHAMRYSVLAKGAKRAPPVMCVAACELFGADRLAAFPTACALEMVKKNMHIQISKFQNNSCFCLQKVHTLNWVPSCLVRNFRKSTTFFQSLLFFSFFSLNYKLGRWILSLFNLT